MSLDRYGLFKEDGKGPTWRAFYNDLEEAKADGKRLAVEEDSTFFVYCFERLTEVARFLPPDRRRTPRT